MDAHLALLLQIKLLHFYESRPQSAIIRKKDERTNVILLQVQTKIIRYDRCATASCRPAMRPVRLAPHTTAVWRSI